MIPLMLYRQEILDFLKTVSIKFQPFADIMAANIMDQYGITVTDETNPYYLNMCGLYHPYDTVMTVYSIDTETIINFDLNLFKNHPKTASLYYIGSDAYIELCQKYPTQTGLIKSIVYPSGTLDEIIKAPNFTILNYDDNFLHSNEKESLITAMLKFTEFFKTRYYLTEYNYEKLFPIALWSLYWYLLPAHLLVQRILNLRTSSVHPFHIWEYLESKGISNDYKTILTNTQSLFLYRNFPYLLGHSGENSNLIILADNLLSEMKISIVAKYIMQQTGVDNDAYNTLPEFISEDVVSYRNDNTIETYESMDNMINRLYILGLESKNSTEYIDSEIVRIGNAPQNIFPTKFLELKKNTIDSKYENLLMRFVTDTFMYRYANNKLQYLVKFYDRNINTTIKLDVGSAITLAHYAFLRSYEYQDDFTDIPTKYICKIPYKLKRPTSYCTTIPYGKIIYPLSYWVDAEKLMDEIPFDNFTYKYNTDFMDSVAEQFKVMISHTRDVRQSGELLFIRGMSLLYDDLLDHKEITFSLTPYKTYEEFFNSDPDIRNIIDRYNELPSTNEYYELLCISILENLMPLTNPIFKEFLGTIQNESTLYKYLVALLVQLSSYNIEFLDSNRGKQHYLFLGQIGLHREKEFMSSVLDGAYITDWFYDTYNNIKSSYLFSKIHQFSLDWSKLNLYNFSLIEYYYKYHYKKIIKDKLWYTSNIKHTFTNSKLTDTITLDLGTSTQIVFDKN